MTAPTTERPKTATRRPTKRVPTTRKEDLTEATETAKRVAKKTPPKAAPKAAPEVDLSAYAEKEPSTVNKAEARFFIEGGAITVDNQHELELVQKAIQLTAGTAHRLFQGSKLAHSIHGK